MKIAIDIRNVGKQRTGSEIVVSALTRRLITYLRDSDELYLLTNTSKIAVHERVAEILNCKNITNVHISYVPSGKRFWWMFWGVRAFLKAKRVEVFHTEYLVPLFIEKHVKVLTHIHDVSFCDSHIRGMIPVRDRILLDLFIGRSLTRANCIIAVSDFTRSEIIKYFPQHVNKIVTIYNAPQDITQRSEGNEFTSVQAKYNIPQKYIFAISTMQPRKNIPFLIRAFAEVAERLPDIDLVLAGPKAYNFDDEIMKNVKDSKLRNRIHFTGYVDTQDLLHLYGQAEMFVSPSLYEGFGVPLLEAAAQRTLVACSDIPVYHEIVGNGAIYFDPTQIDQCIESIYTGCTDLKYKSTIIDNASKRLSQYSWDESAQKFWETLRTT